MDQVKYILKNVLIDSSLEELVNEALKGLKDKEIVDIKFQTTDNLMDSVVQIHYRDKEGS